MKKTLIISPYAPPSGSGSGLMMYNILSFIPEDRLVILTSEDNQEPKLQQYRLRVPYYYYGSKALALKFNEREEKLIQKFKRALKNIPLAKFFAQFVLLAYMPRKIVKVGMQAIREQNIEQFIGFSDWGLNLLGVYLLYKKTEKPFSLHFYDMYAGNKMPLAFRVLSHWLEPRLFRHAQKVFVMCEGLKEYYEKKYNREVIVIHNSIIFNQNLLPDSSISLTETNNFKIIFIGSIYWAQIQALKKLIEAIKLISEISVSLELYTQHSVKYLNSIGFYQDNKVKFLYCSPQEVFSVLNKANAVFVGLSIDTPYQDLINTSCPGKLCDYLVCGRPILVYGPKESFLCRYARENQFAVVVDDTKVGSLKRAILSLVKNPTFSMSLSINAWKLAKRNHFSQFEVEKLMKNL